MIARTRGATQLHVQRKGDLAASRIQGKSNDSQWMLDGGYRVKFNIQNAVLFEWSIKASILLPDELK